MALYAIGDLHLSLGVRDKSMEIFGPAWTGYVERIGESLSALTAEDTLILAGDTSWGMTLEEAEPDFRFLDAFPCRKFLIKGNHDYWWNTVSKMRAFFAGKRFSTLDFIHNDCAFYPAKANSAYALCGTRGWFMEEDQQNRKVFLREVQRLETSLRAARKEPGNRTGSEADNRTGSEPAAERRILCFLHYPPLTREYRCEELLELLRRYGAEACFYGHLHGYAIGKRVEGRVANTEFALISADYLKFVPKKICD